MRTFSDRPLRSNPIAGVCRGVSSALLLASFSLSGASAQEPTPRTALAAAEELFDAFNRHDGEAMASVVTSDFELYYVDEKGVASLDTVGPEQLSANMARYFASRPSVRSTIVGAIDGPVFVSLREQIVGGQSSLAVYEVRDGLIRRVWYFPAEGETLDPARRRDEE